MTPFRIFIGYDSSQDLPARVLRYSLLKHSSIELDIQFIRLEQMKAKGFTRERDPDQSTEFTYTRFMVPYLCDFQGTALFMDSDILCLGDVKELVGLARRSKAIQCVQMSQVVDSYVKMNGKSQTWYPCKNWSSVMLLNCAELKCWSLDRINTGRGSYLHQFVDVSPSKIGELPSCWNTLDVCQPDTKFLHFTSGGPWLLEYKNHPNADLWNRYKEESYGTRPI